MLDVYDSQLAQYGLIVQERRRKAIFMFNEIFASLFEQITGIGGVTINYEPSWKNFSPASQAIVDHLFSRRDSDKLLETTMSGRHRDKINFVKDGALFVQTASTGQCRLISLLLRVAQAIYYTRATGMKPVLLMDDVLLELDPDKRAKLTAMLPEYEQLFCTFLPGEPYERYMHDTTKVYKIENGEWHE
jgi:DNA replication and repair protein RecF